MSSSTLPPSAIRPSVGASRACGVVFLHAIPKPLCSHIEWALDSILGTKVSLDWQPQPVAPSTMRTEWPFVAPAGSASRIASTLRTIPDLVFEVTEEPSPGRDGERYAVTPSLGLHRATIGAHGEILVSEDRLRAAVAGSAKAGASLIDGIAYLLGAAWDTELEPYRTATADTPVRVLNHVI